MEGHVGFEFYIVDLYIFIDLFFVYILVVQETVTSRTLTLRGLVVCDRVCGNTSPRQ